MFLTTAINYANGPPHIGHAYEAISTDLLARWYRLMGHDVHFLTGSDEHGEKIEKTANDLSLSPQSLVNQNVKLFQNLNQQLNISNDYYIRTTSPHHKFLARFIFQKLLKENKIYLGTYKGWYNPREESFISDIDAKKTNYIDPISKAKYNWIEEPSFFFNMETYRSKLIDHIQSTDFIPNQTYRNLILKRLEESLKDLSVTRTSFNWGIPISENEEEANGHILYVWFDALINYLSGGKTENNYCESTNPQSYFDYWTNNPAIHIIGKDILWFHAVIWPCILFALDLPLPKRLIVHGFINDSKNLKMSKSIGNVVDPIDLLEEFNSDQIRYYLIREGSYGLDIKFSTEELKKTNNKELIGLYGNLTYRVFKLIKETNDSKVPTGILEMENLPLIDFTVLNKINDFMNLGQISNALNVIIEQIRDANLWIYNKAPWKKENINQRPFILRDALEKILFLTLLLYPFIPSTTKKVLDQMNFSLDNFDLNQLDYYNLIENDSLPIDGKILFEKLQV